LEPTLRGFKHLKLSRDVMTAVSLPGGQKHGDEFLR
jgi:hypothetical protein